MIIDMITTAVAQNIAESQLRELREKRNAKVRVWTLGSSSKPVDAKFIDTFMTSLTSSNFNVAISTSGNSIIFTSNTVTNNTGAGVPVKLNSIIVTSNTVTNNTGTGVPVKLNSSFKFVPTNTSHVQWFNLNQDYEC